MSFCPHVQQSTSLGSFRGLAEEDPDEGLNASRVAPAVFPLEAFNVLDVELKKVFSLLARRLVVRCTLFLGSFIEALGVKQCRVYRVRANRYTVRYSIEGKAPHLGSSQNTFYI